MASSSSRGFTVRTYATSGKLPLSKKNSRLQWSAHYLPKSRLISTSPSPAPSPHHSGHGYLGPRGHTQMVGATTSAHTSSSFYPPASRWTHLSFKEEHGSSTSSSSSSNSYPKPRHWNRLWQRGELPLEVCEEMMRQVQCVKQARMIALRVLAFHNALSPSMIHRLVDLHVHHNDLHVVMKWIGSKKLSLEGYESVLQALVESNRSQKAWEIYTNLRTEELLRPTENMILIMLRACILEKHPSAADRLIEEARILPSWKIELLHIMALGTRQRTLGRALDLYYALCVVGDRNLPENACFMGTESIKSKPLSYFSSDDDSPFDDNLHFSSSIHDEEDIARSNTRSSSFSDRPKEENEDHSLGCEQNDRHEDADAEAALGTSERDGCRMNSGESYASDEHFSSPIHEDEVSRSDNFSSPDAQKEEEEEERAPVVYEQNDRHEDAEAEAALGTSERDGWKMNGGESHAIHRAPSMVIPAWSEEELECQRALMRACERCGHSERAKVLWRKICARREQWTHARDLAIVGVVGSSSSSSSSSSSNGRSSSRFDEPTLVSFIGAFKARDIPLEAKEKAIRYVWGIIFKKEDGGEHILGAELQHKTTTPHVGVTVPVLNALIGVFGSAGLLKNVIEMWESFPSFNLEPDCGTFAALLESTRSNHEIFTHVWTRLMVSEFVPTPYMCDMALETLVHYDDLANVAKVLEMMHTHKIPLRRDLSKEAGRFPALQRLLRSFL